VRAQAQAGNSPPSYLYLVHLGEGSKSKKRMGLQRTVHAGLRGTWPAGRMDSALWRCLMMKLMMSNPPQAREQASGGKIPDFPLDRYHFVEKQMEYGLQGNNAIAV
jgi:hypothetical protein